jgi:hypothetical protein
MNDPMGSPEREKKRAALVRQLADRGGVIDAGRALRQMESDDALARQPAESLSREQEEQSKLAHRRQVLQLLKQPDGLIPSWIARLVDQIRSSH